MKRRIRPLASVLLAAGAAWFWGHLAAGQQAEDTTAQSLIAASWHADSMSMAQADGKHKTLSGVDQRVSVIIAEKTFTMRVGDKILADMTYTLDTKPSPWTIDLKSPDGAMLGICTRIGDELKISLNDEAQGRPANFDRQTSGMLVDLKRQRRVQLSVINADGAGLHKVAAMPDFTRLGSPDWSRDGKKIAFDGWQEAYGANLDEAHVFVVNADGGGLKDLGPGCMPSWSPDDKQLTYCQYKDGDGVWIMNADGSNRHVLDGGAWGSQWSPVRNEIAIGRDRNLCIHDVATGKSRALLNRNYNYVWYGVSWSPDGKWISFLADLPDGGREYAAVSTEGEEKGFKVLLPSSTPGIMTGQCTNAWGGNGNQIVVSVQRPTDRALQLYVIDFTSDKEPQLFPGVPTDCWSADPAWSLDGKRLACCIREPAEPRKTE